MKTKNIFRMLLVAAVLLMGANNVKADNEVVWTGSAWVGNWGGDGGYQQPLPNGTFSSLKADNNDVIRVYGTLGNYNTPDQWGNAWFVQIIGANWNPQGGLLNKSSNNKSEYVGYVDFYVSAEQANILKYNQYSSNGNCAILNGYNITYTSIVINPKANSSISFSNNVELTFGDTFTPPTVTTTPANATVTYSTDNDGKKVVYISGDGSTVYPVGEGTATITGTFAGNDSYNGSSATYTIKVNKPTAPQGAVWSGAVWLGNFGGDGGSQPRYSIADYFSNVQSGGSIRFYGKIGPLSTTYWKLEIVDPNWTNPRLYDVDSNNYTTKTVGGNGFADGYIDIPVDNINLNGINYIILNGNNLTITAIQVIAPNVQTYTASAASASNGTVSLSATSGITAGTTVTVTATPNTGYEMGSISITDANSSPVNYTSIGNNQYTFVMPASNVTVSVTFNQIEDRYFPVNMSSYIYRTFVYTDDPIDFSKAVGLEGYYAKSLNSDGDEVVFEQVTGIVAAGTPLLLKKLDNARETKLWRAVTSGTTPSPNLLVAGNGGEIQGENYYVLTNHLVEVNNGYYYVYVFAETTYEKARVDTDRAYLYLGGGNARGKVSIKFVKGNTNGISNVETETFGNGAIYNLRGQRVERPTKGLYIINGKKVMIK